MDSGYHFTKDQPQQSYVLVQTMNRLLQNKTAIPDAGEFEDDALHVDATGATTGRFSSAPQGTVIYCNGKESLIWGGEEHRCAGFLNYDPNGTFSYDYSEQVQNTQDDAQNVAVLHTVAGGLDASTVLLLHLDNNVTDSSTTPHTVTNNNVTFSTTQKVFGTHGAVLNGTTAYLTIPDHADFDFSGGIWTIDCRAKLVSLSGDPNPVFVHRTPIQKIAFTSGGVYEVVVDDVIEGETGGATATVRSIDVTSGTWAGGDAAGDLYLDQQTGNFQAETIKVGANLNVADIGGNSALYGTNRIQIQLWTGAVMLDVYECYGSGSNIVSLTTATSVLATATWHHIEVSENGDDWYIFVDGKLEATLNDSSRAENYVEAAMIGFNGYTYYFGAGYFDEYRVSNGIIRHTTDFELPSEAYGATTDAAYINVGSTRQLEAIKLYVKTANTNTGNAATVHYWNGTDYVSASNVVDGTRPASTSLAQTGTISFDTTVDIAQVKYHNGIILYWYKLYFDDVSANTSISYATVNAPFQDIKNIWSGEYDIVASCKKWDGSKYIDYTLEVNDTITTTSAVLDGLTTDQFLLLGFVSPQQGFQIYFVSEKSNDQVAGLACYYHDGKEDIEVGSFSDWDGTKESDKSFTQDGVISFENLERDEEFSKIVDGSGPFFYYKLQFDATLGASVEAFYIRGIPNPKPIEPHIFAIEFQGRALLCSGASPEAIKVSATNSPDVYNGDDATELFFGQSTEFVSGISVYNRFGSSIYNFAILCKLSQTWILDGYSPDSFSKKELSPTYGCCAPETMKICNMGIGAGDSLPKNLILWLSFDGPVYCDGGGVFTIAGVESYFNPNDARCVNYDYIDTSFGFYDFLNKTYNLLIPSGTGQATLNVWLMYDILRSKWTKKETPEYPSCGFVTQDTKGAKYTYLGFPSGYLRRDEHGTTFDGTAITHTVIFSDLLPTDSIFDDIRLDFLKLICKAKNTGTQVSINLYHRANGDTSWTALTSIPMWDTDKRLVKHLQRLNKFGIGHELKFEVSTSDIVDGFEPVGLGLLYHTERVDTTLGLGK